MCVCLFYYSKLNIIIPMNQILNPLGANDDDEDEKPAKIEDVTSSDLHYCRRILYNIQCRK